MNWLLNLSTRTKFFLAFGLLLFFLATVMVSAWWGITSIQTSQQALYEKDFADVSDVQEVLANIDESRANVLSMILSTQRAKRRAKATKNCNCSPSATGTMPRCASCSRN